MSALPTLAEIQNAPSGPTSSLAIALEVLFEHSPILVNVLEPQLSKILKSIPPIGSYSRLIDTALEELGNWEVEEQSEFISGHPRIGESKNLSTLSASEQGARGLKPTPPGVLARLARLNACYERRYPGLRYITFVNGRSRATIAEEMEDVLGYPHSLSDSEPTLESISSVDVESEEWKRELSRAVYDIGRIAKSRLGALGVN